MFCANCGKPVSETSKFCVECGAPLSTPTQAPQIPHIQNTVPVVNPARVLSTKQQNDGVIWLVISILQLIIGFIIWWPAFIAGIINIIGAIQSFRKAKKVLTPYPGMVKEYEKQLPGIIIALIWNLIAGGIIGIAGNIYELSVRSYALSHKEYFEQIAASQQ